MTVSRGKVMMFRVRPFWPAAFASLALLISDCGNPIPPRDVPRDATYVAYGKEGGWAYCTLDRTENVNRCRQYNWRGQVIHRQGHEEPDEDDVFLPYEGSGPVLEGDLQIDSDRIIERGIWLRNGVILLPRNDYENQKRLIKGFLDRR